MAGDAPSGTLVHGLPRNLENLLIVYCPGDGRMPLVWRRRQPWPANEPMVLKQPFDAQPLVVPYQDEKNRVWKREGYLGQLIAFKTGRSWTTNHPNDPTIIADSQIVQAMEMLSFYSLLPPPDFRSTQFMNRPINYDRHLGRSLDLTPLSALRCVILIGHIKQGPLPTPMTVDGQTVSAQGWTVVRWIGSLE